MAARGRPAGGSVAVGPETRGGFRASAPPGAGSLPALLGFHEPPQVSSSAGSPRAGFPPLRSVGILPPFLAAAPGSATAYASRPPCRSAGLRPCGPGPLPQGGARAFIAPFGRSHNRLRRFCKTCRIRRQVFFVFRLAPSVIASFDRLTIFRTTLTHGGQIPY